MSLRASSNNKKLPRSGQFFVVAEKGLLFGGYWCSLLASWGQKPFLLQDADALSTYLEFDLLAIDNDSLGLQVRIPYLFGVALREADVVAELLALTGDITFTHYLIPSVFKDIFYRFLGKSSIWADYFTERLLYYEYVYGIDWV